MKTLNLSATWLTASLLVAASAFAQSTPSQQQPAEAQKQRTQAWGGVSCNIVGGAKDAPECAAYLKNTSQNLTPSAPQEPTGQK